VDYSVGCSIDEKRKEHLKGRGRKFSRKEAQSSSQRGKKKKNPPSPTKERKRRRILWHGGGGEEVKERLGGGFRGGGLKACWREKINKQELQVWKAGWDNRAWTNRN